MTTATQEQAVLRPRPTREPVEIAPDTFVIQAVHGEGEGPLAVHMNAMLIRGREPVIVDTGTPMDRAEILEQVLSLVDPEDVRWVFVSHDDADHYGNVEVLLELCPHATLVASWYLTQRMSVDVDLPAPTRWRWLDDGDALDVGDRVLRAVRPPLYDSPTTRGLLDPSTGVYWASDCFAAPVVRGTGFVDELDPEAWEAGFTAFHRWNSPWVDLLDGARYHAEVERLKSYGITTIASCHGPTVGSASIDRAFELLHAVPASTAPPQPGQPVLDEIVAALVSGPSGRRP